MLINVFNYFMSDKNIFTKISFIKYFPNKNIYIFKRDY